MPSFLPVGLVKTTPAYEQKSVKPLLFSASTWTHKKMPNPPPTRISPLPILPYVRSLCIHRKTGQLRKSVGGLPINYMTDSHKQGRGSEQRSSTSPKFSLAVPFGVTLSAAKGLSRVAHEMLRGVDTERSECAQHDRTALSRTMHVGPCCHALASHEDPEAETGP